MTQVPQKYGDPQKAQHQSEIEKATQSVSMDQDKVDS